MQNIGNTFSSQIFHRTPYRRARKTTMRNDQEQKKLKAFNPAAQEQDRESS
jgi:hypothetical protein